MLANLDGTEQLVSIASVNGKTMEITPILRVGAIKYHNIRQKWCSGMKIEEMKLNSNVCEIIKSPPKLKFASYHQLDGRPCCKLSQWSSMTH